MAKSKQEPEVVETPVVEEPATVVEEGREPTVQKAPKTTFDERTQVSQPWRNEDGSENRGDVVESEPAIEGESSVE